MKIKHLIFVILLLLKINSSFAQQISIKGKVLESNNSPIEFANIFLQNTQDRSIQRGTSTALDGSFLLEISQKGQYELTISYIGFQDQKKELTLEESIDVGEIILNSATNELGEVMVTSTRKIIERKEDKLVFNVAASPLNSGYDGMEVLQRSPNVIIDNGSITMRNESATVMINGKILNLSGENLTNFISNLRSEDIKNIEIQTHLSANTDAESSGGVINIILKKKLIGFDGSLRTDHTIKGKSRFTNYAGTNFNYGAEKWNMYGSYNYSKNTGEVSVIRSIDYFDTNNFLTENSTWDNIRKRQNYQLGIAADIARDHVLGAEFFATNYQNRMGNISLINLTNNNELIENGSAILDGVVDRDLYNGTLNYAWTLDTLGSKLKVFGDYADQLIIGNTEVTSSYDQGIFQENKERNNTSAKTKIYSIQTDWEKNFLNGLKFETGTKWTYTKRINDLVSSNLENDEWLVNERSSSFTYDEQVLAGYFSISKKFQDQYFLKLGMRVENTDLEREELGQNSVIGQNYTDWFPSAYFSKDLPHNNVLSLSYSNRLRRPAFQFLNNYVLKINDFRYELGNPDLRPEYVHNYEVSFKQKKQTITTFYQKITEAINGIYFLENEISFYRKFNSGAQTQYGVSYNRFGNLTDWWYVNVNASLWHRKFTDEDGLDSFERTTALIRWNNNFKFNKTTHLDLSFAYRSKYEDAYYISLPFHRVNVMLEKTFLDKKWSCRIYFNDIFNSLVYKNERPLSNFKTTASDKPQTRTIRFWVTYRFSNKNKARKGKNRSQNEVRRRL